jgi:hypothetical protein
MRVLIKYEVKIKITFTTGRFYGMCHMVFIFTDILHFPSGLLIANQPARHSADRDVLSRPISASRVTLLLGSKGIIIIIIHILYFTAV